MAQEQHHHAANTDVVTGGGHHPAALSSPTAPLSSATVLCDTNQTRSSQTTDCTDGGGSSLFASSLPFSPPSDDAPSVACLSSASPSSSSSRASSSSSASSLAGAFQSTASTDKQLSPTSEAFIDEPCSSSVEPTSEPLPPPVSSQSLSTSASPQQEMTKTEVPQYEKEKEEDEEAEEEEAYFEERSWKDTEDYAVLIETMEQLHEQRMQALIDMTQLSVLKETFLSDPLTLLNRLHCNRVEDFPQPQHVVELPEIDFSKYAHYAVHDQPLSHYVELALDNYTSSLSSRSSVSSSSHRSFGKKISSTKSSKLAPKHSSSTKKKTKKKAKLTASTKNKQKNSSALKDGTASASESNKMKERGTQAEKTSRSHGNEKTIVHNTTGKKNVSVHPKVQVKQEKLSDGEQEGRGEERKSQNMGSQAGEIKQNTNAKTNTKKTRRKDAKRSSHSSMGVTIKREKGESNEDEVVNICDDSDEEVNPPKLPNEQLEQPKQEEKEKEKEKEPEEKEKEEKKDNNVTTESNALVDSQPSTYKKAWSQGEIKRLQQLLIEYPEEQIASHRWEKIARALGNRTPRQVASKCQKYFLKLAMAGLPVPGKVPNVEAHLQRKRREKLKKAASRAQSAEVTYFKPPVVYMSDDEDDARATATSATNLPTNNNRNDVIATTSAKTTSDDNNNRSSNGMRKRKKAPSGEKRRDNEVILRKKAKKLTQHHGFKCASCKKEPIVGIRWRCKDCEAAFTTAKTTNSKVVSAPLGGAESKQTKADGSASESSSTSTPSSSKPSMAAAVVDLCESCYKKGTFESGSHTRQHNNRFVPISSASSESDSLGFFYDSDYLTFATEKQPNYLDPSFMPS
ncbi:Myblike DNA-binding domain containing protein [Balamuthia mandrillaris]